MFVKDGAVINQKHEKEPLDGTKWGKKIEVKTVSISGDSVCLLREAKETQEEIDSEEGKP